MALEVQFIDHGRTAQNKPDPKYPDGIDLNLTSAPGKYCGWSLPYPAPRCGVYVVKCIDCGYVAAITAVAGRADDPRSVTIPCKAKAN